jgi:hypothetical protein
MVSNKGTPSICSSNRIWEEQQKFPKCSVVWQLTVLVLGIFIRQFIRRDCWWLKCSKFGPFCRLKFWCMLGKCHYRWVVLLLFWAVCLYCYFMSGPKNWFDFFSVALCPYSSLLNIPSCLYAVCLIFLGTGKPAIRAPISICISCLLYEY